MKIILQEAYLKSTDHKKFENERGTTEYSQAKVVDGESDLELRSYLPEIDLTALKGKLISGTYVGDFSPANRFSVRFIVTQILK